MPACVFVQIDNDPAFKCAVPEGLAVHMGDLCIVEMGQIHDIAKVIEIDDTETESGCCGDMPRVLRCATLQDQSKAADTALRSKMALHSSEELIAKHKLDIRLIRVRFSYDRKVLLIVFAAEDRVDYRELIKELSEDLKTRIEMKQIGVRDEAGMIGGMGPCGRVMCCCSWLKKFESINVKMAKTQRLSLNPVAISGMCGRLKCCLRYEQDQYLEAESHLPRDGERVRCSEGEGCVCGKNVLAGKVKVRLKDNKISEFGVEELEKIR